MCCADTLALAESRREFDGCADDCVSSFASVGWATVDALVLILKAGAGDERIGPAALPLNIQGGRRGWGRPRRRRSLWAGARGRDRGCQARRTSPWV